MAKSRILKELANNEISLEVALSRLMIIASDIEDQALCDWAECELNGYGDKELPPYRIIRGGNIAYSGINGGFQVTNVPLPRTYLEPDELKFVDTTYFFQSLGTLEGFSKSNDHIGRDITVLAGPIYRRTGIQCISIRLSLDKGVITNLLNSIRAKLLAIFIKLDREFGCLDDLDILQEKNNIEEIKASIHSIIFHDNSVKIGDGNKIEKSSFLEKTE